MYLITKYCPNKTRDFLFNRNILEQLIYIASNDNIPHIIISGPSGGGKKTLVKFFLEALYNKDINILSKKKYNIKGSSTIKEIEIMQSDYHIVIEPTNTNQDKYTIQEIMKIYAMQKSFNIFKAKRNFKTVVIYNIENLAPGPQAALRRTMEIYARSCRFIMVCNNLSKILDPLRSRCRTFCVPIPSTNEINKVITYISIMEKIELTHEEKYNMLTGCDNNLKKAIWLLDEKRLGCNNIMVLDSVFHKIVDLIMQVKETNSINYTFKRDIRENVYNILIMNIKGSEVISRLMDLLISKIDNDDVNEQIIKSASDAEYNIVHGRRDIMHIDYFIIYVMREIRRDHIKNKASANAAVSVDVGAGANAGLSIGSKGLLRPMQVSISAPPVQTNQQALAKKVIVGSKSMASRK